jgi:hypothetical protein
MNERPANTFERKAFTISRLAEFVSESELVKQIGHPVADWPLVILKEAVDNALDEAEEAGVPPGIEISVDASEDEPGEIIVHDGGRGIPVETVEKLIDYSARTSSRAAYASPTRGAQGNFLQTAIAMPYALAGEDCKTVVIESRGVEHRISFASRVPFLTREARRPVRDFIADFRGLSSTAKTKAICDGLSLSRRSLADVVTAAGAHGLRRRPLRPRSGAEGFRRCTSRPRSARSGANASSPLDHRPGRACPT